MFEPLPALIRFERERQGLTQEALAKLANISRSRLIAVEKGDDNLSFQLLLKVTNALRMKRLYVGNMYIEAAPPDLTVMLAALEALEVARKIVNQANASTDDLERVSSTMKALFTHHMGPAPEEGLTAPAKKVRRSAR